MAEEQKQELSVREKARQDRLERIRQDQNKGRVRVLPRDDDMRAILKHPVNGAGFLATGSVEWPDDAFTQRRIEDGSVTLEGSSKRSAATGSPPDKPVAA
jgi:hypothetical protein